MIAIGSGQRDILRFLVQAGTVRSRPPKTRSYMAVYQAEPVESVHRCLWKAFQQQVDTQEEAPGGSG